MAVAFFALGAAFFVPAVFLAALLGLDAARQSTRQDLVSTQLWLIVSRLDSWSIVTARGRRRFEQAPQDRWRANIGKTLKYTGEGIGGHTGLGFLCLGLGGSLFGGRLASRGLFGGSLLGLGGGLGLALHRSLLAKLVISLGKLCKRLV